ncbi:DYH5 protein, partial [Erpornis zantholeuca]|nr:DYH5 protein [Erpornis zantholeuca]
GISWSTVCYMIGEIQYGGRVTDDFDKRLMNTFVKVWFSENTFSPEFSFYKGYSIPKCTMVDQYLQYIQVDPSKIFGLRVFEKSSFLLYSNREFILFFIWFCCVLGFMQLCFFTSLEGSLVFYLQVKEKLKNMGPFEPMHIFLRQEIEQMQRVISSVRSTLTDLKLAIDGTIVMSENLRDALDCMYDGRVPASWKKASWPSSTLGFWFTELLERNHQFYKWIFESRPNCFWMTGFFNPQGFLTAVRQEITRANKGWALDSVVLCNEVTKWMKDDITSPPSEGVYVYGLYLEGAGWDRRNVRLTESKPKVLFEMMPVIRIYAENNS